MIKVTRRLVVILLALGAFLGLGRKRSQAVPADDRLKRIEQWDRTHDRVWIGGEFWSNPMEDWRVQDGWVQCQTTAGNRSIHSVTRQLTDPGSPFVMSVELSQSAPIDNDGGAGFRIGVRSDLNEYRSNCFAKNGLNAGLVGNDLILGKASKPLKDKIANSHVLLTLEGTPQENNCQLTLTLRDAASGKEVGLVQQTVPLDRLKGNIALVSQYEGTQRRVAIPGYRFRNWKIGGTAITHRPKQTFGPLLWTMYSLSDSRGKDGFVLKLTALTGPLGNDDNQEVELQVKRQDEWVVLGKAKLDREAWTATFRIANWNEKEATPYRVIYEQSFKEGKSVADRWDGLIRSNPVGRPLRLAALTCQNDYAFPYEPVANNVVKMDPDMIYFSGDQLYEGHGGFGIIRDPADPAILNYLRKFYQFGWSFRESMKNAPTICIPDDHDVFQGNIWGEAGAAMKDQDKGASSKGGYREPARMVNVVHMTNCSHHPDFYDPQPVEQDISVYFGDMVYGGVSFAILGDRQWKSGPERVETGSGRADHVRDKDFDTSVLDKPGLVLLGERQEAFLKAWSKDWRGHTMKVLLSQTVFAGVATHHGNFNGYLKADLDSGAWPQTARNRAIEIIRESMALHINGDQHLASICQYGVAKQRDSNWSFCTPAIGAGYPRWWRPDEVGMPHQNRPQHGQAHTGEYLDGFGNKVYVYATGNPEVATKGPRYERAHQKGSGFGFVTIDTEKRIYTLDAFRFNVDPTDGNLDNQFPGWPITLGQAENNGQNRIV
ncbi:MAG TPA: twin-arginine translocation pathway signal [Planctomycetes bacterium]|nr:twin-arginine translocation pathway signal [Planctomycetota bacterium]